MTVAMAALAASWGVVAVLARSIDLGSAALTFGRLVLGALVLVVVAAATSPRALDPRGKLRSLALLGALQGMHWLLFLAAVKLGSVALAVITFYAAPLLIALAAPVVLREALDRVALAALAPGTAGVVLVAFAGGDGGGGYSAGAIAAGLGSAATFAALVLASRKLVAGATPPLTVAVWDLVVGAVVVAPFLATGSRVLPRGGGDWSAFLVLGIVMTGLSTLAYLYLLRHVTAQASGVLTFLEPVVAVVLAAVFLDEELGWTAAVGGALVLLAGLAVVVRSSVGASPAGKPQ